MVHRIKPLGRVTSCEKASETRRSFVTNGFHQRVQQVMWRFRTQVDSGKLREICAGGTSTNASAYTAGPLQTTPLFFAKSHASKRELRNGGSEAKLGQWEIHCSAQLNKPAKGVRNVLNCEAAGRCLYAWHQTQKNARSM